MVQITRAEELINVKREDITLAFINYLFGNRKDLGPRFKTSTPLIIPKGLYYGNDKDINTCMGNFIFNKAVIHEDIFKLFGFINHRMTGGNIGSLNNDIAKAYLNDKISSEVMIDYLNKLQFYGFGISSTISSSMTEKTIFVSDEVAKKRNELIKKNSEQIKAGDPVVSISMEKELLDVTRKAIGNDTGMDLYNSGSKASFDNNFKNMFVMKGSIKDVSTGKFVTSMDNFMDGVSKEDYKYYADAMVYAAYSKGVGPQIGGYLTKKYLAAFQAVVLDKKGSDCGTELTVDLVIHPKLKKMFIYRNIKVNGKLVNLTDENIDKYVGIPVKLYDPCYCKSDRICNKCAGELYYKLGIKNIGLTTTRISSSLLNKSLKKAHDTTLKLWELDNLNDLVL